MRSIAGALAGLLLAGCLRADLNRCNNGAICKQDQTCTEQPICADASCTQTRLCGEPALVEQCHGAGKQQFDSCDFSSTKKGTCHEGICDECTNDFAGCYSLDWQPMQSPIGEDLAGVWVGSISEAYVVGGLGSVLHYDGSSWQHMPEIEALAGGRRLVSVWGVRDPFELFIAAGNKVLHYSKDAWTETDTGSPNALISLWGSGAGDVYALSGHEVYRFTSTGSWAALGAPAGIFHGMWGTGPTEIFIAGAGNANVGMAAADGVIYRYDGTAWGTSPVHFLVDNPYLGIWGTDAQHLFAIAAAGAAQSGSFLDGTVWTDITNLEAAGTGIWASAADDVFVMTSSSILHWDGSAPPDTSGMPPWSSYQIAVNAMSGSARDNVIAVGPGGKIWRLARR